MDDKSVLIVRKKPWASLLQLHWSCTWPLPWTISLLWF